MILLDTSGLLSALDASEPSHARAADAQASSTPRSSSWRIGMVPSTLLTLDERHFRAVLEPGRQPFRLLPADAA